jgi:predicted transcriptional regulator of viral defense system
MTDKQKQIIKQFKKTTSVNEVKKALKFNKKEIENMVYTLYVKKELIRIKKGHYVVNS